MYNFIYINTHDTGRQIGPYGFSVNTPQLNLLAKEATLFTQAYSCAPTCSPSRAAMLTSSMPHTNGMLGLAQRGFKLRNPKRHLANYLRTNGYKTAISGIQHEVGWYFDIKDDLLHEIGYEEILTNPSDGYSKDEYHLWDYENAKSAVRWLKNQTENQPFMLSFGLHSTHRVYPPQVSSNVDSRYVKPIFPLPSNPETREDMAKFLSSAQYADECIGMVISELKNLNLFDKTVILFTTDHGVAFPYHKSTLRDGGIGVSLIIRNPEMGHGKVVDQLVSHIDVFPTICDCLGIPIPDYVEGISFKKMLVDINEIVRSEIYAETNFHTSYEPSRCIRNNRFKYIKYFDLEWTKYNLSNIDESNSKDFLVNNGLKLMKKDMEALYDTFFDAYEKNNLINNPEYFDIANNLRDKLFDYMKQTNDPLLKGELPIFPEYKVNKKSATQGSSRNPEDYDPRGRKQ